MSIKDDSIDKNQEWPGHGLHKDSCPMWIERLWHIKVSWRDKKSPLPARHVYFRRFKRGWRRAEVGEIGNRRGEAWKTEGGKGRSAWLPSVNQAAMTGHGLLQKHSSVTAALSLLCWLGPKKGFKHQRHFSSLSSLSAWCLNSGKYIEIKDRKIGRKPFFLSFIHISCWIWFSYADFLKQPNWRCDGKAPL